MIESSVEYALYALILAHDLSLLHLCLPELLGLGNDILQLGP